MKKTLALMAGLLILGFAFMAAQDKTQTQTREKSQVKTRLEAQTKAQTKVQAKTQTEARTESEFRLRNRIGFIDENGDGLNDLSRDADGDGVPNGQDPDWVRPQDGTGNQARHKIGQPDGSGTANGRKAGKITKSGIGKASFRTGLRGAGRTTGAGVCDGTGPKGTAQRKGRR